MPSIDLMALRIKPSYAYCDYCSLEVSTGTVKKKYKLAGNYLPSLKLGTFFILTSKPASCGSYLSISIMQNEWAHIDVGHLTESCSYTSLNHFETHTSDEILRKIQDLRNTFPEVAKLADAKFEELKKLVNRIQSVSKSDATKSIIVRSLEDMNNADQLLVKLNLA